MCTTCESFEVLHLRRCDELNAVVHQVRGQHQGSGKYLCVEGLVDACCGESLGVQK